VNTTRSQFRWWFANPGEWRQEDETTVTVADGSTVWTYSGAGNTYTRSPLPELSDTPEAPATGPFWAFGPLRHKTIDEYLAMIRSTGRPPMQAAVVGSDEVLGFHTLIVEVKSGQTVTRIWVDPDHMFVLRAGVSDRTSYHAEATTLRYNESVPRDRLRFEPPAGARLVDAHAAPSSRGSFPPDSGPPTAPAGLLAPSDVPVEKGVGR
jgi:outer membrane lipoprotein-sorting protein